jgi:hypothetical protein
MIFSRESRYVALKIVKSARHYTETAVDEIELLKKVADTKPSAPGWNHVVQMYDSFKISGPHGMRILKNLMLPLPARNVIRILKLKGLHVSSFWRQARSIASE